MKTIKAYLPVAILLTMSTLIHGQSVTLKYPSTSEVIANPERGWYDDYYSYSGGTTMGTTYRPLKAAEMFRYRVEDKITLILRLFYLHPFLEEDAVSQEYLGWMQHDFDSIRAAGVKCIVRFATAHRRKPRCGMPPRKRYSPTSNPSAMFSWPTGM